MSERQCPNDLYHTNPHKVREEGRRKGNLSGQPERDSIAEIAGLQPIPRHERKHLENPRG